MINFISNTSFGLAILGGVVAMLGTTTSFVSALGLIHRGARLHHVCITILKNSMIAQGAGTALFSATALTYVFFDTKVYETKTFNECVQYLLH